MYGASAGFPEEEQQKRNVGCYPEAVVENDPGPLQVIWDYAPAHLGEVMRLYLRTPGRYLRLVNLPGYSPDFNADEAIWDWAREEATGNVGLGVQGSGAGESERLSHRTEWHKGGSQTALPDCAAIKGRDAPARLATRFLPSGKCASHFGFGLAHTLRYETENTVMSNVKYTLISIR